MTIANQIETHPKLGYLAALLAAAACVAISTSVFAHERGDGRWQRMDTDRDGSISRSEFDAATKLQDQKRAARRSRMFELADTNKDGKLSAEEIKAFRESRPKHGGYWGRHGGPSGPGGPGAPQVAPGAPSPKPVQ